MAEKNYFELFKQPQTFAVDAEAIESIYKLLMAKLHPDRFVNASALEKRLAEQMSVRVNEARQTLNDDLLRAQYLCRLHGLDPFAHQPMAPSFLMKQMQWREALESADYQQRSDLVEEICREREILLQKLQRAFDIEYDAEQALNLTRELLFIEKLLTQLNQ